LAFLIDPSPAETAERHSERATVEWRRMDAGLSAGSARVAPHAARGPRPATGHRPPALFFTSVGRTRSVFP
jgi:hypothetical protein